jgi:hypothetical protein
MFEYASLSVSTAALGLSVLSVGIAAWSAYTSHKSRQAAERSSEIVRVKREEELAPKFDAWLEFRDGVHYLYLKNLGVVTYASVIFHFIPADGLAGLPITGLQMPGWGEARESADFGLFEAGSTKICIASRRQQHPGTNFRMRLICKDSISRSWTTTATGETAVRKRE